MSFIFYMSSNNGEISHGQSTKVVNILENAQAKIENQAEDKTTNNKVQSNEKTTVQNTNENNLDHIIRKNAHGFMYMVLAILVSSAFFSYNKRGRNIIVYILFVCLFYAVTDEFHQSFVPGRTSLVSDILVDFTGAFVGLSIFYFSYYKIYEKYNIRENFKLRKSL
jgi:VanZ family protein